MAENIKGQFIKIFQLLPATQIASGSGHKITQTSKERGFDRKKVGNGGTTKSTSFGFLMNGAYRVNSKTELFWTGTVNYQTLIFENNHILPRNTAAINTLLFPDGFKAITKPVTWNVSGIAGARGYRKRYSLGV